MVWLEVCLLGLFLVVWCNIGLGLTGWLGGCWVGVVVLACFLFCGFWCVALLLLFPGLGILVLAGFGFCFLMCFVFFCWFRLATWILRLVLNVLARGLPDRSVFL